MRRLLRACLCEMGRYVYGKWVSTWTLVAEGVRGQPTRAFVLLSVQWLARPRLLLEVIFLLAFLFSWSEVGVLNSDSQHRGKTTRPSRARFFALHPLALCERQPKTNCPDEANYNFYEGDRMKNYILGTHFPWPVSFNMYWSTVFPSWHSMKFYAQQFIFLNHDSSFQQIEFGVSLQCCK